MDRVPPSPDSTRQATAFVAPPARARHILRAPIVATVVVIVVVGLAAALVLMLR